VEGGPGARADRSRDVRANKSQAEAKRDKANVGVQDADRPSAAPKDLLSQGLIAQVDVDAAETAYGSRKAICARLRHPSSWPT